MYRLLVHAWQGKAKEMFDLKDGAVMVLTAVSSTTPSPCTFPLPCSCPARTGHLYSTEIMKNSVAFSCSYQLAKCSMECAVLLHILSFSCIWGTHGTLRVSLLGWQGCNMVSALGRWRRQLRTPPPPKVWRLCKCVLPLRLHCDVGNGPSRWPFPIAAAA